MFVVAVEVVRARQKRHDARELVAADPDDLLGASHRPMVGAVAAGSLADGEPALQTQTRFRASIRPPSALMASHRSLAPTIRAAARAASAGAEHRCSASIARPPRPAPSRRSEWCHRVSRRRERGVAAACSSSIERPSPVPTRGPAEVPPGSQWPQIQVSLRRARSRFGVDVDLSEPAALARFDLGSKGLERLARSVAGARSAGSRARGQRRRRAAACTATQPAAVRPPRR